MTWQAPETLAQRWETTVRGGVVVPMIIPPPLPTRDGADVPSGAPPVRLSRGLRVLLVDDGRVGRALARQLELDGHRVTLLPDGRSALALLGRTAWDLVCLDAHLRDVPATWLARRLREQRRTCYLVLSNRYCFGLEETRLRPDWIDAILPQPCLRRELETVLAAALARRAAATAAA
jgi:DNA-binding response OmpR family regulator